jgi:hypothetical protein
MVINLILYFVFKRLTISIKLSKLNASNGNIGYQQHLNACNDHQQHCSIYCLQMVINPILYFVLKRSYTLSSNGHQPNNIVAYIFINLNPILFSIFILYFFFTYGSQFFQGLLFASQNAS